MFCCDLSTNVGLFKLFIILAIVKVFPDPVTPGEFGT